MCSVPNTSEMREKNCKNLGSQYNRKYGGTKQQNK